MPPDIYGPFPFACDGGGGEVTLQIYGDGDRMVCGVYLIEGRIRLPFKAFIQTIRAEMAKLEDLARKSGCSELRLAGRKWSRVFPDYQPIPELRNGLRKVL